MNNQPLGMIEFLDSQLRDFKSLRNDVEKDVDIAFGFLKSEVEAKFSIQIDPEDEEFREIVKRRTKYINEEIL